MAKNPKKELELIDLGNSHCIIKKGDDKIELNFSEVQELIIKLGKHFNDYDKLPF